MRMFRRSILGLALLLFLVISEVYSAAGTLGVTPKERRALVAMYKATDGSMWLHRDGWLGPPGSECGWYGVTCGTEPSEHPERTVQDLDLRDNGLTGQVPPDVDGLVKLKRLDLRGNKIKRPLPEVLLRRFDEGRLEIAPLSLIHDVEEVSMDVNNSALLCSERKARISSDGSVRLEQKLCREHDGQQTREVFCEQRQGRTYEFDLLARFLVRIDFFSDSEPRTRHQGNDTEQTTVRAKLESGGHTERSLGKSMSEWSLRAVIEGIIARTEWAGPPVDNHLLFLKRSRRVAHSSPFLA